ncbi:MAG: hypothetical protein JXR19_07335 [Bacteroidia bacterium]
MIRSLSNNLFAALAFSLVILSYHFWTLYGFQTEVLPELIGVFVLGIALNFLCRRFRIIGMKSHFTVVIFCLLASLIIDVLDLRALVAGGIWILAVYFSFRSWEDQDQAKDHLIYIGILLGIGQILDHHAFLLFFPFFILFYQNAVLKWNYYFLSLMFFFLVLIGYLSFLFAIDQFELAESLIPKFQFEYAQFWTSTISVFLPLVVLMLVIHLFNLRNYRFRYPNRSIKINLLFGLQLLIALLLMMLTSASSLFILLAIPSSILLSVGFTFKQNSFFINAVFLALILVTGAAAYLFH